MIDQQFTEINLPSSSSAPDHTQLSEFFTLTAPPHTSLWREPQSRSTVTAPMLLTCLRHPLILAEVTISADFENEWDQGGLVIFIGSPPSADHQIRPPPRRRQRPLSRREQDDHSIDRGGKWVKAGLEFTGGTLHVSSVVATAESGADWSISPLYPSLPPYAPETFSPHLSSLRIKFERIGDALWIWYRVPEIPSSILDPYLYGRSRSPESVSAEWRKLREVMGFFCGVESKGGVWVGCYASRPMDFIDEGPGGWGDDRERERERERNGLVVEFEELEII